jgi:hypothetical protein
MLVLVLGTSAVGSGVHTVDILRLFEYISTNQYLAREHNSEEKERKKIRGHQKDPTFMNINRQGKCKAGGKTELYTSNKLLLDPSSHPGLHPSERISDSTFNELLGPNHASIDIIIT